MNKNIESKKRNLAVSEDKTSLGPRQKQKSDASSGYDDFKNIIMSYDIDTFDFSDKELIELLIAILNHYNLVNEVLKVTINDLRIFLNVVCSNYHTENSFHNFKHICSVTHLCFLILVNGADAYLEPLDILGSLFSAIFHDIGHPGNNNAFESVSKSDLFKKYSLINSQIGVLEQYHSCVTYTLLTTPYTNSSKSIISNLNKADQEYLLNLIENAILGTDMGKHSEHINQINNEIAPIIKSINEKKVLRSSKATTQIKNNNNNNNDEENKKFQLLFTSAIVHTADIGAQTQSNTVAYRWMERCYKEFQTQADKETSLGIVSFAFLHDLKEDFKIFASQYNFINDFIEPLWKAFTDVLPNLKFAYNQLIKNKKMYRRLEQKIISQEKGKASK